MAKKKTGKALKYFMENGISLTLLLIVIILLIVGIVYSQRGCNRGGGGSNFEFFDLLQRMSNFKNMRNDMK